MAVAPDGSLYFGDWIRRDYAVHGHGHIWHLIFNSPRKPMPAESATQKPTSAGSSIAALDADLTSDDPFVRAAAVWDYSKRDDLESLIVTTCDRSAKCAGPPRSTSLPGNDDATASPWRTHSPTHPPMSASTPSAGSPTTTSPRSTIKLAKLLDARRQSLVIISPSWPPSIGSNTSRSCRRPASPMASSSANSRNPVALASHQSLGAQLSFRPTTNFSPATSCRISRRRRSAASTRSGPRPRSAIQSGSIRNACGRSPRTPIKATRSVPRRSPVWQLPRKRTATAGQIWPPIPATPVLQREAARALRLAHLAPAQAEAQTRRQRPRGLDEVARKTGRYDARTSALLQLRWRSLQRLPSANDARGGESAPISHSSATPVPASTSLLRYSQPSQEIAPRVSILATRHQRRQNAHRPAAAEARRRWRRRLRRPGRQEVQPPQRRDRISRSLDHFDHARRTRASRFRSTTSATSLHFSRRRRTPAK